MLAQDVMTSRVTTVRPDAPISEAVRLMVDGHLSGLPVVNDRNEVVGVLTEGDLLRRVELATLPQRAAWLKFLRGPDLAAEDYVRSHARVVEDIMTRAPVTVTPDTWLSDVVSRMESRRVRRLPVVRDGRLVGVVSRADLVRALDRMLQEAPVPRRTDQQIHDEIRAELDRHNWSSFATIGVDVMDGVVRLAGMAQSDSVRAAVRALAEQVPGVRGVENGITVEVPPLTLGA